MTEDELHLLAKTTAIMLTGSHEDYPFGEEHLVYRVKDKIFLFVTQRNGVKFLTLKSDPEQSKINRAIFEDIKPGYHMNKKHWISVYAGRDIHEEIVEHLIKNSYNLIISKLTKKERASLV